MTVGQAAVWTESWQELGDLLLKEWQPLLFTFALHLILLLLCLGWSLPDTRSTVAPDYVKARLVQLQPRQAAPVPQKTPPKVVDVPRPPPAVVKPSEAQKRDKEKQQREAAERARAQQQKADRDKAEQKKAEEKKAAQEQALRAEAEAERRRADEALARALAQEQAQQQQLADAELVQGYAALIKQRVEQNWSRPPSARNGMKAVLEIQLVPTGYVVGVTVLESSGHPAFDLSAEQAVKKAERFVEIKDMPGRIFEAKFRRFQLTFNPEDKL